MAQYLEVTLANIGDGTMDERFHKALKDVVANVQDMNCPAQAKREIKISIVIVPDEQREQAAVAIDVRTTLAPQKRKLSQMHFVVDRNTAKHKAVTANFDQQNLFDPSEASQELTQREAAARAADPTKPAA